MHMYVLTTTDNSRKILMPMLTCHIHFCTEYKIVSLEKNKQTKHNNLFRAEDWP